MTLRMLSGQEQWAVGGADCGQHDGVRLLDVLSACSPGKGFGARIDGSRAGLGHLFLCVSVVEVQGYVAERFGKYPRSRRHECSQRWQEKEIPEREEESQTRLQHNPCSLCPELTEI